MAQTLSVLILAKNEADKIARCLESVAWADERVVVDDFSTDATAAICRQFGALVVQRTFDNFSAQANFGLTHLQGDWVLALDADELVTPELRDRIRQVLRDNPPLAGFSFKRRNYFLGHPMRYGGWYHDIFRLFRRDAVRFAGELHHVPQVSGRIGRLDDETRHFPFQSLVQFIERQNRYSSMGARERLAAGRPDERTLMRQLRTRPVKLLWKFYVKKQGFREGTHGVVFSVLYAWVHFLTWAKCWEGLQSPVPQP